MFVVGMGMGKGMFQPAEWVGAGMSSPPACPATFNSTVVTPLWIVQVRGWGREC